jgi:hypothetical protein
MAFLKVAQNSTSSLWALAHELLSKRTLMRFDGRVYATPINSVEREVLFVSMRKWDRR